MTELLLLIAGLLGGAVNTLAGGGSFIVFPALLAVGVPPVLANASNTYAALPGYVSGAVGYWGAMRAYKDRLITYGIVAALFGYAVTRAGGAWLGMSTGGFAGGAFLGGMAVAAVSNLYGRLANRPGALVRVPGIILLVPGSVSFRSLGFVMERDVFLGLDTAFVVVSTLVAIVAGLLFGNLLVPSRRNL